MELIKMTRGTDTANVRPEWVEDWEAQGWEIEGDKKPVARRVRPAKAGANGEQDTEE